MDLFKSYLKTSKDDESLDATRHSVVILMGTLAQHLNNKDDEVRVVHYISVFINVIVLLLVTIHVLYTDH